ncbi:nuclear transport factor 2 family protein [Mycobacteroides chelonae]|uniref:Polyketide cyclase n=1 Tax=Mycobacteroides chelonae TaxID=1774 RepID=A0A1S1LYF2_MYCCH|nr:nuclear transport factor 2 family protein [Mycobacteroides chelonae]OHU77399.1 polyketide cyclase [Mycobacteroides chelonae]QQG87456.1 SnoaL-like domain-containing protein [Mycobacteroides chelonae]QQG92271.1 SnoaL-like domain-containing protein [Mycobacteroides chelonae]
MPSFSRAELEEAFAQHQATVHRCIETGDWNPYAEMYTDDALYIEHVVGRLHGKEAIRQYITAVMAEFPGNHMPSLPATWTVFDPEKGWVVCEIDNVMSDPGDGQHWGEPNLTVLHYAGNGLWSQQEDAYNPANMVKMVRRWCRAAETSGSLPEEARDWLAKYGSRKN